MRMVHYTPRPSREGAGGGRRHKEGRITPLIYGRPVPLAPSREGRGKR